MEQTVATGTSGSPGLRLLCIPELVLLISRYTRRADLARLAQHVDGAGRLLALVKSTSLHYRADKSSSWGALLVGNLQRGKLKEVVLSEEYDSNQFERFDYYAPFVRSLNVYPCDQDFFYVSGWQLLAARCQKQPILPNLTKLSIAAIDSDVKIADTPLWIKLLGNQNLTDISWCIDTYPWPDMVWTFTRAATRTIMGHLVDSSPNIQQLRLGSHHPDEHDDYHYWVLDKPPRGLWHQRLHELPRLRQVSMTHGWIGRIGRSYFRKLSEECSASAFPALRHLSLRRPSPYTSSDIFEFLRLFEHVTKLEVHFMDGHEEDGWVEYGEEPFEWSMFSSLSNVLRLESLLVTSLNKDRAAPLKCRESLDAMAQLPLQKIDVTAVALGKAPFAFDMRVVWPNVTELILPCQIATLQELACFAAVPLLMRLVVTLDFTTTSTPTNIPTTDRARLTTLESARGGRLGPAPGINAYHVLYVTTHSRLLP